MADASRRRRRSSAAFAIVGDFQRLRIGRNGDVIAIANYSPAEVVTYNVKTKAQTTLSDPYGGPFDIAIDKEATIYALNVDNVAVFKTGSSQPTELTCSFITGGVAIAVDTESDVFVNGYGPTDSWESSNIRPDRRTCKRLHLRKERGYVGGVGIDPKTDDLIVVDNPDLCAGGHRRTNVNLQKALIVGRRYAGAISTRSIVPEPSASTQARRSSLYRMQP